MSTRANIGIKRLDGTIETVYNHSDGYPEWLGNNLIKNYTDKEDADKTRQMVEMILSLGDISFLDEKLQDSRFYNSWRNEETKKHVFKDIKEYETWLGDSWIEWVYIFDLNINKWVFASVPYGTDSNELKFEELSYIEEE